MLVVLLAAACGGGSGGDDTPLATHAIWGTVRGEVVEGVTVTLSGDADDVTQTDLDGDYRFGGLLPGTYVIVPTLDGTSFSPPNRIVVIQDRDVVDQDFTAADTPLAVDTTPPANPVRLVFVHHSVGTIWLNTGRGNLGDELGANNYYVRDVTYGWDAPENQDVGDLTDIGHWYLWFVDDTMQGNGAARRDNILGALYATDLRSAVYSPIADPGGENDVILFKSCYPNSNVQDDNALPPSDLFGQDHSHPAHTLSNCQEVYRQLLQRFRATPNKLFVVVTAPPLVASSTNATLAANARALNDWLVNDWLAEERWEGRNVGVFDYFNVLTDPDNHHRVVGTRIDHDTTSGDDFSAYGQGGDSHPTDEGHQKATAELVPLLNVYTNRWRAWLGP